MRISYDENLILFPLVCGSKYIELRKVFDKIFGSSVDFIFHDCFSLYCIEIILSIPNRYLYLMSCWPLTISTFAQVWMHSTISKNIIFISAWHHLQLSLIEYIIYLFLIILKLSVMNVQVVIKRPTTN